VLDLVEAALWIALLAIGGMVAWTALRLGPAASPQPLQAPDELIEAEELPTLGQSRPFTYGLQSTEGFPNGRWSLDGQMFAVGTRIGDWVELALPPMAPGPYRLEAFLTRAADYGIVRLSLNGAPLGPEIDLWSYAVEPTGAVDLGLVALRGDGDVLRIEVTGHNPAASNRIQQFGIDGIRLTQP
jgi:hypothetical protein